KCCLPKEFTSQTNAGPHLHPIVLVAHIIELHSRSTVEALPADFHPTSTLRSLSADVHLKSMAVHDALTVIGNSKWENSILYDRVCSTSAAAYVPTSFKIIGVAKPILPQQPLRANCRTSQGCHA